MRDILSNDDIDYITNKKLKKINYKICGLFIFVIINTLLLMFISGVIVYYVPSINSIIHIVDKHKDNISSTINTLTSIATKVDTISDTILNFKSIAKNKLLVTLCGNSIIHGILGSYFCSDNSTHVPNINMLL